MERIPSLVLVDGERAGAVSGATLDVINPATNDVIGQIPRCDADDVETARHFIGAPFGGVKNSGVGREEDLTEIESYTQLKSVNMRFG